LVDHQHAYLPDPGKPYQPEKASLGILPGSRKQEVTSLLGKMLETARVMHQNGKIESAEILKVPNLPIHLYHDLMQESDSFIRSAEKPMYKALPDYDAAIVASGTATLETGYFAVPMVIVYQVNTITYWLARMFVKITHVGLVNIVAEKEVARELIQDDFTVQAAVSELERLLDKNERRNIVQELRIIQEKLGKPGASKRAADAIVEFYGKL
jgi:lipid-A-disaccharide synthase